MKYVIVQSAYTAQLSTQIEDKIAEGYELYGNPFAVGSVICQAMIKEVIVVPETPAV